MTKDQSSIIHWLLEQGALGRFSGTDSFSQWNSILAERSLEWKSPMERAIAFGFLADRVAYAFAAGFRSALQHLIPNLDPGQAASFCVTEREGNHPRAIKTSLEPAAFARSGGSGWLLNGHKTFITAPNEAEVIFVAASTGIDERNQNHIRLVRLDRNRPGIDVHPMDPLPFIPEISHGSVTFSNVAVSEEEVLPGNGYETYVKPFRIIEEIHVMASLLGYLTRLAFCHALEEPLKERLLSLILLITAISRLDLSQAESHLVFAGFQQHLERVMDDFKPFWDRIPQATRKAWFRDRAVLKIAGQAREKRLANAWLTVKS